MIKNKYHDKFCVVPWQNQPNILPKNIFQTFENCDVSLQIKEAMQTWQQLNPTWAYHFYTAGQRRSFIQEHFQSGVLDAYDALIPGSYQADMWRFCVLYIHGGIYADHKVILNKPLEDFVPNNVIFAAYKDSAQWQHAHYVLTGLLIAQPQHPIFLKAIACIVGNVAANDFGLDPLCPTGPGLLGKAFNLVLQHEAGAEIQAGVGAIEGRPYQLFSCPYDTSPPTFNMFGVDDCFALYPSHRDASISKTTSLSSLLKSDYAAAWFLGKIYQNKEQKPPQNRYAKKRRANYLRRKIRALLKQGYYELAHTLIKATLGENRWQPKVWWYGLKSLHK
jgi:hypothetical protein